MRRPRTESCEILLSCDANFVVKSASLFQHLAPQNTLALTKQTLTASTPQFAALRIPYNGVESFSAKWIYANNCTRRL